MVEIGWEILINLILTSPFSLDFRVSYQVSHDFGKKVTKSTHKACYLILLIIKTVITDNKNDINKNVGIAK